MLQCKSKIYNCIIMRSLHRKMASSLLKCKFPSSHRLIGREFFHDGGCYYAQQEIHIIHTLITTIANQRLRTAACPGLYVHKPALCGSLRWFVYRGFLYRAKCRTAY